MLALQDAGYAISVPFGENTRYDLVIDNGTRLERVQCKTGRFRKGAIRFATCSTYAHHKEPRLPHRDYVGEIDSFAVYCHSTNAVYLVPIKDVSTAREGSLRVDAARNNQKRLVRRAEDYVIRSVVITREPLGSSGARGSCA